MYAVIKEGSKEYRVAEGDVVDIDLKSELSPGDEIEFDRVLLLSKDEGDVAVGTPEVEGAKVTATVEAHVKGPKVVAYKYKRRQGYHRKKGHRQQYTRVRVTGISG
jgi:large subunit ribosomal protein L21